MKETSYVIAMQLKAKLIEDIAYAEAVIYAVGEPCDGFSEHLLYAKKLLLDLDEFFKKVDNIGNNDPNKKRPSNPNVPDDIPIEDIGTGC
jgi:hypothetical protein